MTTIVTGACTVTFQWKVSSQSGSDFLEFWVDNERRAYTSGEQDWESPFASPLTITGDQEHSLECRYTKDPLEGTIRRLSYQKGYLPTWLRLPGLNFLQVFQVLFS